MPRIEKLTIRPYARLLTMLGEQLIKNERIALIELIKNAYDADATWVKVSFENFDNDYEISNSSRIIVEDNGHGMTVDVIKKHWLNPATPDKKKRKDKSPKTRKGRVMQGEKGIGRFAAFKLGQCIRVITKDRKDTKEHVLNYDFSCYDHEFLKENNKEKELYLDDLSVSLHDRKPETFETKKIQVGMKIRQRGEYGTRIEISDLKGKWSKAKIQGVFDDVARFQSIFDDSKNEDFIVVMDRNGEFQDAYTEYKEKLQTLLQNNAVLKIKKGVYDEDSRSFSFVLGGKKRVLPLSSTDITGLKIFRDKFGKSLERSTECGTFEFEFFVFDFGKQVPKKYELDREEKKRLRDHRIYLYRDGIRVYPYGDPEDDWLHIDALRGTQSAGMFLSNDQVVGHVNITQTDNPRLKDKTNREGLIEDGNATYDFIALLQTFLMYIRRTPFQQYRASLKDRNVQDIFRTEQVRSKLDELKEAVEGNQKASELLTEVEKTYATERSFLVQRAETTEELAGVGLSVETASHDIMSIMNKATLALDSMIREVLSPGECNKDVAHKELQALRGMLDFIHAQLKDIQLLFKSSKQRRRNIRVREVLEKVEHIFSKLLKKEKIKLNIIDPPGSPLLAKTTDAVLLQLFLNLFDNSVYWLQCSHQKTKQIEICLDGNKGQLTFSDNGPGISKEDAPYVFEPFYSGKGEDGRGLGLYIARQLLERNDYTIDLAELKSDKRLSGANFVVSFVTEGE